MSAADKQLATQLAQPEGLHANWRSTARAQDTAPDEAIQGWLSEGGLLTQRLRDNCGERFKMRLLDSRAGGVSDGLRREVLLCCGDHACIYAVTEIPATTLAAHDWLSMLGDEPLGEALRSRDNVTRSAFEYALIDAARLPADINPKQPVWARRSEFSIGGDALAVTEVFLPGLAHCSADADNS